MAMLEYLLLIVTSVLVVLLIGDEEPVFDLSDLNFFNVALLALCTLSVFFDNIQKSLSGQNANSDRQVFSYVGFK